MANNNGRDDRSKTQRNDNGTTRQPVQRNDRETPVDRDKAAPQGDTLNHPTDGVGSTALSEVDAVEPAQETPQDINSPTITGFTAEERRTGQRATIEQPGVKTLDFDNATKLRDALNHVIGYQTGSMYRHDFESGLDVIRSFGFTVNTDRADADATRVQEATLANDRGSTDTPQDVGQVNPADAPLSATRGDGENNDTK